MRLGVVVSPGCVVTSNAVGLELMAGAEPSEVFLLVERGLGGSEVRRCRDVVGVFVEPLGSVVRTVLLGGVDEWLSAPSRLGLDVVDLTPGRKIHALALLAGALGVGTRPRYAYLVDERLYGYRYFGYAPFHAIRLLEIAGGDGLRVEELSLSIPRFLDEDGGPAKASLEAVHAALNLVRVGYRELELRGCGGYARLVDDKGLVVEELREPEAPPPQCMGEGLGWCLRISGPVPNMGEVVEGLRTCVERGCDIVPDTNVLILGVLSRAAPRLRGIDERLRLLDTVAAELLSGIEHKYRGDTRASMVMGVAEAYRHGLLPAPPARPMPRGDQAIRGS